MTPADVAVWVSIISPFVTFAAVFAVLRYRVDRIERENAEGRVSDQRLRHEQRNELGARIGLVESDLHDVNVRLARDYHSKDDLRTLLTEMLTPIRDAQREQNSKLERILERTRAPSS